MCVNNVRTASVKRIYDEYVVRCVPTEQFVRIKFHGVFNIRIIRIINWVVESAKNKTYQTKKEKQNKTSNPKHD